MKPNLFNSVQYIKPKKSHFDLSHDVKLTTDFGQLTPVCCFDCVPGDKFNISCELLLRFQPMLAPIMHRVNCFVHYFFVPNRILWDNWENFITQDPNDDTPIVAPYISYGPTQSLKGSLADYLGLPMMVTGIPEHINALPFAAYQRIYNEYYRDENLMDESAGDTLSDGDNSALPQITALWQRAWEHDYFTSCLPFAQKGSAVDLPIGSITHNVQVLANAAAGSSTITASPSNLTIGSDPDVSIASDLYAQTQGLSVGSTTINDLRRAFRLQEWLEKNARGGTRYIEHILAHFGVKSSDKRLQRPEYITGVKTPVIISEVLNTTGEVDGLPQGNMAGHGVSVTSGHYGSYFCEEHGFIIGIMSVMPKTAYQDGIHRMFTRPSNIDYYYPAFANLGEQEVLNREVYADAANQEGTFGYNPRYAEYKFINSRVAGEFRDTLDYWHLGRIFDSEPALDNNFITCNPFGEENRIFAVTSGSGHLLAHCLNKISAIRPMPKYGSPSGI